MVIRKMPYLWLFIIFCAFEACDGVLPGPARISREGTSVFAHANDDSHVLFSVTMITYDDQNFFTTEYATEASDIDKLLCDDPTLCGVFIYSESAPGAQDWENDESPIQLTSTDNRDFFGFSLYIDGLNIAVGSVTGLGLDTQYRPGSVSIFSESIAGAKDWENDVTVLRPIDEATGYGYGVYVMMEDEVIVVGSSTKHGYNFNCPTTRNTWRPAQPMQKGAFYIYYESALGAHDWQGSEKKIVLATGSNEDLFGLTVKIRNRVIFTSGPLLKVNGKFSAGKLHYYKESAPYANDWELDVTEIVPTDAGDGTQFNENHMVGIKFAVDDDRFIAFNYPVVYAEVPIAAPIWVYTASTPGAQDFASNELMVRPSTSRAEDLFGLNGVISGQNMFVVQGSNYNSIQMWVFRESAYLASDWMDSEYLVNGWTYDSDFMRSRSGNTISLVKNWRGNYRRDFFVYFNSNVNIISLCPDLPGVFLPCDCTGESAIGVFCNEPCVAPSNEASETIQILGFPSHDQCNCTGTNAFLSTCGTPCLNGGVDIYPWEQCDCTALPKNVGTACQISCNNGYADKDHDACNCTGSGATGGSCQKDIDDCESSPCMNSGSCTDFGSDLWPYHANEFNCSCDGTGYHGVTCEISNCVSSPCLNNGMCEQAYALGLPSGVQCNCSDTGYEGDWCQTEIDECASDPCLNDGVCTDLLGYFTCDCAGTGYEGLTCAMDVDDCLSSPCEHDGACQDKGTNKFKCNCNEFWEGDTCSDDVDDCILKGYYCENGAACVDDPVNMGDVMCTCIVEDGGFTGKYCNVPVEDACVTFNPCANGGKCIVDVTNAMSCDCADTGYEGDVCDVQVYISECVSSPCLNEGQCYDPSDQQDDWFCECTAGYSGEICDFRACDSMPCENGGTCSNDDAGGYICACAETYSGAQCQTLDDDQVQADLSSSSSSATVNDDNTDSATDSTKESDGDGSMPIIIVIAVVTVGILGALLYFYKKKHPGKPARSYMMPT